MKISILWIPLAFNYFYGNEPPDNNVQKAVEGRCPCCATQLVHKTNMFFVPFFRMSPGFQLVSWCPINFLTWLLKSFTPSWICLFFFSLSAHGARRAYLVLLCAHWRHIVKQACCFSTVNDWLAVDHGCARFLVIGERTAACSHRYIPTDELPWYSARIMRELQRRVCVYYHL